MRKNWIIILLFITILIPPSLAEQNYEEKALNYDSYIQSNTSYITFFLAILALIIGIFGVLGWKGIKDLKQEIKKEVKTEFIDIQFTKIKEEIQTDLMNVFESDQNKMNERLNKLSDEINGYKSLLIEMDKKEVPKKRK